MKKTESTIVMPKLGLTMTEGILESWNVKVGSKVSEGDILFSVETDKAITEIEAKADGEILSIKVEEGVTVDVGVTVATWTGPPTVPDWIPEQDGPDAVKENVESEDEDNRLGKNLEGGARVIASPSARNLARTLGLDISAIASVNPGRRVSLKDVEAYSKKHVQEKEANENDATKAQ